MPFGYLYTAQNLAKNNPNWTSANTNQWKYHMSGVPFIGDFIRASDQTRYFYDYLNNRGIDWSKVKYPSLNIGSGSYLGAGANVVYGAGYAYVSKNLMSLYRNSYTRTGYRGPEYL